MAYRNVDEAFDAYLAAHFERRPESLHSMSTFGVPAPLCETLKDKYTLGSRWLPGGSYALLIKQLFNYKLTVSDEGNWSGYNLQW